MFKELLRNTSWQRRRRELREMRQYWRWLKEGRPVPPPHTAKQMVIKEAVHRYRLRCFVETGTYLGDMVEAMLQTCPTLYSIELCPRLCAAARKRFAPHPGVQILEGDSAQTLPLLLEKIDQPTAFWLDGHFSEGITARAEKDTPIETEIKAILRHKTPGHVILIDDAHEFTGDTDYPSLAQLKATLHSLRPELRFEVADNIIRILPPSPW